MEYILKILFRFELSRVYIVTRFGEISNMHISYLFSSSVKFVNICKSIWPSKIGPKNRKKGVPCIAWTCNTSFDSALSAHGCGRDSKTNNEATTCCCQWGSVNARKLRLALEWTYQYSNQAGIGSTKEICRDPFDLASTHAYTVVHGLWAAYM